MRREATRLRLVTLVLATALIVTLIVAPTAMLAASGSDVTRDGTQVMLEGETPTPTPSETPAPTDTPTPSLTPTPTPALTPTPTPSLTPTPTPSLTPTPTPSLTPTPTPSLTPTPTPTPAESPTPPAESPTPTPEPPAESPTPPAESPTPTPQLSPTPPPTPAPDSASGAVPAGGTVTTDPENDGATPSDPVESSVQAPVAGTVTIQETSSTTPPPSGYSVLGVDVAITAPAGSQTNPIVITLRLDASAVPVGQDETTVAVLRNGVALPDCTGAPGVASLDPCISSRTLLGDGDLQFVALTSAASLWQLATTNAYAFSGFFAPVANSPAFNNVNSGQALPLKFSLGGNFGLNVLASGWPKSREISCTNFSVLSAWTTIASNGGLSHDSGNGQYTIVWKTDKQWANSCREVNVRLDDGTDHLAVVHFTK